MYNIIFRFLYTLQCAHHQKFSFHLSPYCWPPLPILFSPTPFPSGKHCSGLCIYMFVFVWFGLFMLKNFHIWVKSYGICLSLFDLFYLA